MSRNKSAAGRQLRGDIRPFSCHECQHWQDGDDGRYANTLICRRASTEKSNLTLLKIHCHVYR